MHRATEGEAAKVKVKEKSENDAKEVNVEHDPETRWLTRLVTAQMKERLQK